MKNKAKPASETARQWEAIGSKDAEIERLRAALNAALVGAPPRADKADVTVCPHCRAKFRVPMPSESKPVSEPAVYVTSDAAGTKEAKE